MSKRKLSIIEEAIQDNIKRVKKEKIKSESDYEESLSSSFSQLSISDDDEEKKEEEDEYKNDRISEFKTILKEEGGEDYEELKEDLEMICDNLSQKKITMTKILKSNLMPEEKEKAVELYGVLMEVNPQSYDYIQLHKLLQDMISGTMSHLTSAEANQKLKLFQEELLAETPTLDKIIASKISHMDKMMAIQLFQSFYQIGLSHGGLYSAEWFSMRKRIIEILDKPIQNEEEFLMLEKEEGMLKKYKNNDYSLKSSILKLDVNVDIKKKIYNMYETMMHVEDEHERSKLSVKIKWLVNLPYNKVSSLPFDIDDKCNIKLYCDTVYNKLTESIYGMNKIKEKLLIHINNRIYHKKTMSILALKGMPGVGKTKIIQALSEATGIPYAKLSLGGVSDTTLIYGHNQVWQNSSPGMIMQYLSRSKCSDMIILLDEIDKLSNTERGTEVQHALLHLLDQTQNKEFNDAYLDEFPHDISRIWFIATLNDDHHISQPLKDRLDILDVPSYSKEEIVNIIVKYVLPQAVKDCGLMKNDVSISESACFYLISHLLSDIKSSGMRLVEKEIKDVVLKLSFLHNNSGTDVSFTVKDFKGFPYKIEKKTLKSLLTPKSKSNHMINMMYC